MTVPDYISALTPLLSVFKELGIEYQVGGSVASSAYGMARTTLDIDIVADIRRIQVPELVNRLENGYYIAEPAVIEALENQSCFNLIHLKTMLKIDIFTLKSREYNQQSFQRARNDTFGEPPHVMPCRFAAPEDIILNKLEWYKAGSGTSERQWNDVLGVLKVQGDKLDFAYMRRWAAELDIAELLEKAINEQAE